MIKSVCSLAALLVLSAGAGIATAGDVSIPFANHGGIQNWEADGERGIWVQDVHRQWYYAKFMSPCQQLPFVERVGFVTEPGGQLDRFSSVRARGGQRCVFTNFELSKGPPAKARSKTKHEIEPAAKPAPEAQPGK